LTPAGTAALTLHNKYVLKVPKVLEFYETRHCNSAVKHGEDKTNTSVGLSHEADKDKRYAPADVPKTPG
jgi:hypothetical protein